MSRISEERDQAPLRRIYKTSVPLQPKDLTSNPYNLYPRLEPGLQIGEISATNGYQPGERPNKPPTTASTASSTAGQGQPLTTNTPATTVNSLGWEVPAPMQAPAQQPAQNQLPPQLHGQQQQPAQPQQLQPLFQVPNQFQELQQAAQLHQAAPQQMAKRTKIEFESPPKKRRSKVAFESPPRKQ